MTSRLDRLFILLESGSSAITRRAAAKQIGEVQRLHPHELHNLLNRLVNYLHSSSWDTRIAAAQAVEAILSNVPKWNPKICCRGGNGVKKEEDDNSSIEKSRLSFNSFNLEMILEQGARLMGSEGTEFDCHQDTEDNNKDVLLRQRALLSEKFGLNNSRAGITIDELVTLDDMKTTDTQINMKTESQKLLSVQEMLNNYDKISSSACSSSSSVALSCREKNRARRKARQTNILSGVPTTPTTPLSRVNSISDLEPDCKRLKSEADVKLEISCDPVPDGTGSWNDVSEWPFETFCSKLYIDLLSPRWETRHGAATALRELLKAHSDSAGKSSFMTIEEMENGHEGWMEDVTLRLLCVLALDRFGDFISDQVVAPVRETCAQVLGAILKQMTAEKVEKTIHVLITLTKQKEWEVRHGGLLGIKYLLVVREDLLPKLLPLIIKDILHGLFDPVDDVGAVAASTLTPIAAWLPKLLSTAEVSNIVKMLWDLLLDQDELTSACNSFMALLSSILCLPNAATSIQMEPMSKLVPRLWPFLCHSSSSVRRSTLHTLLTLTQPISVDETTVPKHNNGCSSTNGDAMKFNYGVRDWPTELLQDSLRQVFQRVLVEHIEDVQDLAVRVWNNFITHSELSALLHAICPWVSSWLCLAMQPVRLAFDPNTLVYPRLIPHQPKENRLNQLDGSHLASKPLQKLFLGGTETTPLDVREKNVTKARCKASKMLGLLSKYIVLPDPGICYSPEVDSPIERYTTLLISYLSSRSALQRLISGMVIANWALYDATVIPGPPQLQQRLLACLNEYIYYDEVALLFTRLLQESHDLIATLKQHNILWPEFETANKILTLDQIQNLSTTATENLKAKYNLKPKVAEMFEDRRKCLFNSFKATSNEQNCLNISIQSALAGAVVCLKCLPDKLNPVIKPLMESIKREECQILQKMSATHLVLLLDQISTRDPCPNSKIITNLCRLLKSDTEHTPKIVATDKTLKQTDGKNVTSTNPYHGILTLFNRQKSEEIQNGHGSRGPGRPPAVELPEESEVDDPNRKFNQIQRIGATFVIITTCTHFGPNLKTKIPIVWELMIDHILNTVTEEKLTQLQDEIINDEETQSLIISLQLIEIAAEHIHESLHDDLFVILPHLCLLLNHPFKVIRHLSGRCLAVLASVKIQKVMDLVIDEIVPYLGRIEKVICRQGAAEAIACIVNKLQYNIVPYVVLLVVPLLGRMSDPDMSVRLMSTQCFAMLIQLMPLDGNAHDLPELSEKLKLQKEVDRKFLDYLFTPKKIPDFKLPIAINAELRSYQQNGINWLWFLNKYKLHGILCDDMGLGKTLQTICILAGDHHEREDNKQNILPSIVICPPTLTGHWVYEVGKFLPNKFLKPLHYVGLPADREKLRHKISRFNLVVASYDIVRKDIDFFSSIHWNYCVLDEGHIIKNGKTKSSKAIKTLVANHRLILSGTPIQNNVLELWSLFDFLMPGFLGTEKQFIAKFSRPILASRDGKSSAKEQEAGALAMEGLHRQVLPFLLRRVKEDVLTDLPPKITQDLLCELSPLQEKLYEDLSKRQLNDDIRNCLENIDHHNLNKTHVFQALRYLQNVCNHPKLVLKPTHPEYQTIFADLARSNSSLDDIDHSGKLPALKQLLLDCGIGIEGDISVNQHRALIFCQLKAMLDIIENDLLKRHLPAVSYLRLDGGVPAGARHDIVTKFNNDPSIDVLLLTTQVGGLGLNLTGADTVIFVEHDWNPMKDLQAMDRAHRIGQKKVVNVYRLITRKSLEEKIMGLQKFKLLTANTIVNDENASMDTMGTEQILDLFNLENDNKMRSTKNSISNNGDHEGGSSAASGTTMKSVLENLPELWDDRQYEEEYDLSQFLEKLK